MPIYSGGKGISSIGVGHHRKEAERNFLMITPLVDMLTILLIFLLMNFAASGQLMYLGEIYIPHSTSRQELEPSAEVAITNEEIFLDGFPFLDDIETIMESPDLMIKPLFLALSGKVDEFREMEMDDQSTYVFTGKIVIQADKSIPFRLLKKVIYTADRADFTKQSLAVYER